MKRLLVGNWKMILTLSQAISLAKSILPSENHEVVVCPSFIHLSQVREVLQSGIKLGAQNVSRETFGAFTGDICAEQLKDIGCEYTIIGHSERRIKEKETNTDIHIKLNNANKAKLKQILCVGETLEEYNLGMTEEVIQKQLADVVSTPIHESLVIAYEPIWAIGSGLIPTAKEVERVIAKINAIVPSPVIYGGSVDSKNSGIFSEIPSCKGFLIGGASLKPEEFNKII